MKKLLWIVSVAMAAAGLAAAGPLVKEHVSPQAQWLVHFDADQFRKTEGGEFYVRNLLERHLADSKAKHNFDFGPLLRSLKSATAYGTEREKSSEDTGVLLLQAAPAAVDEIGKALAAWLAIDKEARIRRLHGETFTLYQIDKETLVAPLAGGRLLFAKSARAVEKAWAVLAGKAPNLAATALFKDLNQSGDGVILTAAADDLNKSKTLPPQAKIFSKAENFRAVLGERGGQLVLQLSLNAESAEAATQVRQLMEGLLAWVAMDKPEDKELQLLVKSARITVGARKVSAAFQYPVERLLKKMADGLKTSTGEEHATAKTK